MQRSIAFSSAESELHASVEATVEALGVQPLAHDLRKQLTIRAVADVSAVWGDYSSPWSHCVHRLFNVSIDVILSTHSL